MPIGFDAPEHVYTESNFLSEPGTHHMIVAEPHEVATKRDGTPMDACAVLAQVLDGTVRDASGCTQVGKQITLTFFNGKPTDKDGGKFARSKQAALFIALDLMTPEQLGKPGLSIDLEKTKGRQFIVTLKKDKGQDGKERIDINFNDIYHVDDPAAAAYPKDSKALGFIAKAFRHPAAYFDSLRPSKGGGSNGAAGVVAGSKPSNGNGGSAAEIDLSDI